MTIYLLKFFLFLATLDRVLLGFQEVNLVLVDNTSQEENPVHLLKYINESLVLGCYLKNNTDDVNLKWIYYRSLSGAIDEDFSNESSIATPYVIFNENGILKLNISNLQLVHNGKYKCEARINDTEVYNQNVTLIVKSKPSCEKKFDCDGNDGNQCISTIYKCDGVADCKTKSDESPEMCGPNPCEGRIKCSNGRCIPEEWCERCDPQKINCTNWYIHDCCPNPAIINIPRGSPYSDGSYPRGYNNDYDRLNMQQHYDINFIQTTIYTIIGCALVFMIIGTVLVVAICRIHMRRSPLTHVPNNRRTYTTTAYHRAFTQEIGVYDLDIAMNRAEGPGLLVTYNINNGVQIVGSPVEPPPYSEIASLPPREGPPPPYTLSNLYDNNTQNLVNVRSAQHEASPKSNNNRPMRHGLSNGRVSSEPSLLNVNRL